MKTVYYAYNEEYGEVEGMFDEAGELLGTWCCNDANWRHEYFDSFMLSLGVSIVPSRDAALIAKLGSIWNDGDEQSDDDENDDEHDE